MQMAIRRAAITISKVQPITSRGLFIEGKFCGSDSSELEAAFKAESQQSETMSFHLCVRPDGCEVAPPQSKACWHIELWRTRKPDACGDLGWSNLNWQCKGRDIPPMIEEGHADIVMSKVAALKKKIEDLRQGKVKGSAAVDSNGKGASEKPSDDVRAQVSSGSVTPSQRNEMLKQLEKIGQALEEQPMDNSAKREASPSREKSSPAAVLAKRASERKEPRSRSRGRKRSRSRRRRRRKRSSTESNSESSDFRSSRHSDVDGSLRARAKRAPGRLVKATMHKMKEYLGNMQGDKSIPDLAPIATSYLRVSDDAKQRRPGVEKELWRTQDSGKVYRPSHDRGRSRGSGYPGSESSGRGGSRFRTFLGNGVASGDSTRVTSLSGAARRQKKSFARGENSGQVQKGLGKPGEEARRLGNRPGGETCKSSDSSPEATQPRSSWQWQCEQGEGASRRRQGVEIDTTCRDIGKGDRDERPSRWKSELEQGQAEAVWRKESAVSKEGHETLSDAGGYELLDGVPFEEIGSHLRRWLEKGWQRVQIESKREAANHGEQAGKDLLPFPLTNYLVDKYVKKGDNCVTRRERYAEHSGLVQWMWCLLFALNVFYEPKVERWYHSEDVEARGQQQLLAYEELEMTMV